MPNYSITDVPDFDQKRDARLDPFRYGLPPNDPSTCSGDPSIDCDDDADCGFDGPCIGVGGGMYCFPTSAIDWMAYLANHGYPQVDPGPAPDWQSMDVYNLIGQKIDEMGVLMNTNPSGGTGGENGRAGIEAWLAPHAPLFSVVRFAKQGTFTPRLEQLAKAGLSGQLVIAGIGYYDLFSFKGIEFWVRDGGHLMPFVGASFTGNPLVRTFEYRNPSRSDSTIEQSNFFTASTTVAAVTGNFIAGDEDAQVRTHDRLDDWSDTDDATFLDAYTAIVPFKILTATPVGDPPGVKLINPVPIPPTNIPAAISIPFLIDEPDGRAVDGAFSPTYTDALVISEDSTGGGNQLWLLDLVTEDVVEIVLPDEPGLVVTQRFSSRANAVNRSRNRAFYIVDRTIPVDIPLPSGTLADALAYDDANDQLYVLSTSSNELLQYPADLATSPILHALPAVIAPTGSVDLDVSRDGSEIWIADAAGETIYGLTYGVGGGLVVSETIPCCTGFLPAASKATSSLPDNNKPEKLVNNGTGFNSHAPGFRFLIFLDSDPPDGEGVLLELERDAGGGWQAAANPLVSGMTATGFIDSVRSRTNYDPATMSGPAWRNVLPSADFGELPAAIPTVSSWGLVVMTLLVLAAGSVVLSHLQRKRQYA